MSTRVQTYRGTKFFKYLDPLTLNAIQETLENNPYLEMKGYDLNGKKTTIKSSISLNPLDDFLFGTIHLKTRRKENNSDEYFWTYTPFDFIFSIEPSALIIHGSIEKMDRITKVLDDKLHGGDDGEDDPNGNPRPPSFNPYHHFASPLGKYIVRKITKRIEEAGNNLLFDPHFKRLDDNNDVRGGECFWRRDGHSATEDERFCYLFELCSYWEPELFIRNCGGIRSVSNSTPYNMTISADFSFRFTSGVKKEELDQFWTSFILPILLEDSYDEEQTECVESSRNYLARITQT